MKKTRFTDEQMVTILREADRRRVSEVGKRHGVSAQTIDSWRKHVGTLEPVDVKRLRQLEQENGRLKKMVADRDLEIDVLKEITRKKMVGARVRRQPVASVRRRGLSSRRACAVLSVARSTLGYQARLQQRDAPALAVMRELAGSIRGTATGRSGSWSGHRRSGVRRSRRSVGGTASGRWRLDRGRRWPGGGRPDTSGAGQWSSPRKPGIGHAPQRFAKAASERIRVELSPPRINSSAAVLAPTPKLSHREGDVSVVSRVRCRSCVVISSARVNQRRAIERSVCLADAAGVSRGPGRSAAQRVSSWRSVSAWRASRS